MKDRQAVRTQEDETRRVLKRMERRDLGLLAFPLSVIALLALGLILSDQRIWDSKLSVRAGPSDELAFLTLNLVLYIIFRHRRVRSLYTRLLHERIHTEALTRRLEELRSILSVSSKVRTPESLDSSLALVVRNARECLAGNLARLHLRVHGEDRVIPAHQAGCDAGSPPPSPLALGSGIAGSVADQGRPIILSDRQQIAGRADEREGLERTEAVLSVPLLHGKQVLGALTVAKRDGNEIPFSLADLQLLMIFADFAAHVIHCASQEEEIRSEHERNENLAASLDRARRFLEQTGPPPARAWVASRIGHDLANPLTSILGYSQLLQQLPLEGKPREYAGHIFGETRRCQTILDGILSRLQGDDGDVVPCDVNRLVEQVLDQRAPSLHAAGVDVRRDLESPAPSVRANPVLLEDALAHLVANAEEAMAGSEGPKRLRVTTSRSRERVRICVEDSGHGVPKHLTARIFEPFFSTHPDGTATGLGLSIASRIIRDHGGVLRCESSAGRGARFVVELDGTETAPRRAPREDTGVAEPGDPVPGPSSLDNAESGLLQSERLDGR